MTGGEGTRHAAFIFGRWWRGRRVPISEDRAAFLVDFAIAEASLDAVFQGEGLEEFFGLEPGVPARVEFVSDTHGFLGECEITPAPQSSTDPLDWRAARHVICLQRATHCWGQYLSSGAHSEKEIGFAGQRIHLPNSFAEAPAMLALPCLNGGRFDLRYPPINRDEEWREESWVALISEEGVLHEILLQPLSESLDPSEAGGCAFAERVRALFTALREDQIFGVDVYGEGWSQSEGWDLAAEKVPRELRQAWGWDDPSDMSLCWVDSRKEREECVEEISRELYSAEGMLEEYYRRVDLLRIPPSEGLCSLECYFDGVDDNERKRIAGAIAAKAQKVGLKARWNGDINSSINIGMHE